METRKQKFKRVFCNGLVLLFRFTWIFILLALLIVLIQSAFTKKGPYLFLFASMLEILSVLIIFLAELFSSSFKDKWKNPKTKNFQGKASWTKKYVMIDDIRYSHYVGLGFVFKWLLDQAERILWIPNDIKRAWFGIRHSPTAENCNIIVNPKVTIVGTFEDLQNQINELKEYSSLKILGYFLLFIAFILHLIYGISTF